MIDYLKGRVVHYEAEYVVVDVQDIGYQVFTPNPYAFAKAKEAVMVYIHQHVREDAILLYGFQTRDEQTLFRKLIEVSGIGPRVALGVLAGGKPEVIITAIQQENLTFLTKLPGIGKKTAQRMVLDLKDKLVGILGGDAGALAAAGLLSDFAIHPSDKAGHKAWQEAREALAALGYTSAELDKVWQELQEQVEADESVDSLMKRALQQLFKG